MRATTFFEKQPVRETMFRYPLIFAKPSMSATRQHAAHEISLRACMQQYFEKSSKYGKLCFVNLQFSQNGACQPPGSGHIWFCITQGSKAATSNSSNVFVPWAFKLKDFPHFCCPTSKTTGGTTGGPQGGGGGGGVAGRRNIYFEK